MNETKIANFMNSYNIWPFLIELMKGHAQNPPVVLHHKNNNREKEILHCIYVWLLIGELAHIHLEIWLQKLRSLLFKERDLHAWLPTNVLIIE